MTVATKLAADDLTTLWNDYTSSGSPDAQEALWLHYESLARYLARRALAVAPAHQDPGEILSFAHYGLLKAIEKFDPDLGYKFETYATRKVTGAIKDGQRKNDPLSRSLRTRVKAYGVAKREFWDREGRPPSDAALAEVLEETVEGVRELHLAEQTLTEALSRAGLDGDPNQDYEPPSHADHGDAEAESRLAELRNALSRLLPRLPERERAFVILYYCEGRSFRDIADDLEVSVKWCEKVKKETLVAIRAA